jgi:hypothetical protein
MDKIFNRIVSHIDSLKIGDSFELCDIKKVINDHKPEDTYLNIIFSYFQCIDIFEIEYVVNINNPSIYTKYYIKRENIPFSKYLTFEILKSFIVNKQYYYNYIRSCKIKQLKKIKI